MVGQAEQGILQWFGHREIKEGHLVKIRSDVRGTTLWTDHKADGWIV